MDMTLAIRLIEALEKISVELEKVAFELSEDGTVGEQLYLLRVILDEVVEQDRTGRHFLRILDIGRD